MFSIIGRFGRRATAMAQGPAGGPWGRPRSSDGKPSGDDSSGFGGGFGSGGSGSFGGSGGFDFNVFRNRWGKGPGGRFGMRKVVLLITAVVLIWLLNGFYRVEQGQVGIELVFGKLTGEATEPGLNYNFPWPIGEVILPRVQRTRKTEVGYREAVNRATGEPARRNIPQESLMLTTDQNVVDVEFAVFWRIGDPIAYLFNIRDPEGTIKIAAESAMREVVGNSSFDAIVTEEKREVGNRVGEVLQQYLDFIGTGIMLDRVDFQKTEPPEEVIDAFNDVQRARQDLDRLRNEADAYRNSKIPEARGQAEQVIKDAEAYRERLVQRSQGEAARFLDVYRSYRQAPEVTRRRMYLEAVGEVLKNSKKVIIDPDSGGGGVIPLLPLGDLGGK